MLTTTQMNRMRNHSPARHGRSARSMRCIVLVVDSRPDMNWSPIEISCSLSCRWPAACAAVAEPPPSPYSSTWASRACRRDRKAGAKSTTTRRNTPRSIAPTAMGRKAPEMPATCAARAWPLTAPSGRGPAADASTTGSLAVTSAFWTVRKGCPSADPSIEMSYVPTRPGGTTRSNRTWEARVLAAVSKAVRTAARSAALATAPPPAFAKATSVARPASLLNATTSARTLPSARARIAAARCDRSAAAPSSSATVSSPSLSSMMLRSPVLPSAATDFCTAS